MSQDESAKLARMAAQIAAFFHTLPEDQAAMAIATHINQFWAPPMRRNFLAHFTPNPTALAPLVQKALPLVRAPARR